MLWALCTLLVGHVPFYDDASSCTASTKEPDVSVVYYAKISAGQYYGVERHCSPGDCPFDGGPLTVGFFAKQKYDPSTFSLRIG